MRFLAIISILLCCLGCSGGRRVTINRIAPGMEISEVRAVAGKLHWVARTPNTHHYRVWFVEKADCKVLCKRYPVLLTFDNDAILVDYRRNSKEELRRAVEGELSSWDYCDDDCGCNCSHWHCFGERSRSYTGRRQIGADIYRAISNYGQALLVP